MTATKLYQPFAPNTVIVIGCGGIGMQVILNLARFMAHSENMVDVPLVLVDGDSFEDRNLARQFFTNTGNKAVRTGELLGKLFPLLKTQVVPYYVAGSESITDANRNNVVAVEELIEERDIVFVCVDNHPSRKLISKHAQALSNTFVVNGGNSFSDGSAHCYLRIGNTELLQPIEVSDPSVNEPTQDAPFQADCIAAAAAGNEQLIFSNMFAATLMLTAWFAYQEGRLATGTVHFDLFANQGGLTGPAAMLSP